MRDAAAGPSASGEARPAELPSGLPRPASGQMTAGSLIVTAARRFRNKEAIICAGTGRHFTFEETNERCNRLAQGLLGLGLGRSDVVAFLCGNRAEIAEIYFALAKAGIVGMPLNYRLAPSEVGTLLRAMHAGTLLFDTRFAGVAAAVRPALPDDMRWVAIGADAPGWALGYEDLLAGASPVEPEAGIVEADPFYFNLTSGTTGLPKAYLLNHRNICAPRAFDAFEVASRDVVMTVAPAFGRIGVNWIFRSVLSGARNVLLDFAPAEALRLVEAERVTIVNLVPTMAAMLLAEPELPERDLRSLRAVIFAGSPLPRPLRERVAVEICPHVWEYYGLQESGAVILSTPDDRVRRPDSVGLPLCFCDVRILRPDGSRAAAGELGEIVVRSPGAVAGYVGEPTKSAETFRDGWVHTGDLGCMDEEGYLFIRGRLKDMVITGGQNVHAAEVEEAILPLPGVIECAVFGLPDDLWGEQVAAVVVIDQGAGATLSPAEVEAACRARLAAFKIPRTIRLQPEPLPRTPTGKVQKFLLSAAIGAGGERGG